MADSFGPPWDRGAFPPAPQPPPEAEAMPGGRIHLLLFLITVATTMAAGALLDGADILADPWLIWRGAPFAVSLLLILGIHETAHYITSRRYGLRVTLPYFIPAPTLIGTMGAVIKIKSPITDRRALLDIGVSGPLAGFAACLPIAVIGLRLSEVRATGAQEGITLGSSLLFNFMVSLLAPGGLEGQLVLHPVAFAAWVGMMVTALNLLPIGQLDGGHIICALFGRAHRHISLAGLLLLIPLGFLWEGWLIWALLLTFMGWKHPPPLNSHEPLDPRRRILGWTAMAVFALTFTPVPFSFS